jgi:hypothetical protein
MAVREDELFGELTLWRGKETMNVPQTSDIKCAEER